jgi:pilus assembly protein Flp/PilA
MISLIKTPLRKFAADESGATAIEYGLIAALISVLSVAVLTTIGTKLNAKFELVSNKLN